MRTAPWVVAVVLAAAGCTSAGGTAAQTSSASSAPAAAAHHELTKVAPSPHYPLTTCVVSGDSLGAMGDRVAYSYDGTEVQFCCPGCIDDFKKDPDKFVAKVRAASK